MKLSPIRTHALLTIFVILIFGPLYYYQLLIRLANLGDFNVHIRYAQIVSAGNIHFLSPHFLFEVLLILFHSIATFSYPLSALIIVMLFQCFTAIVIFNELAKQFGHQLSNAVLIMVVISLLLIYPILLLLFLFVDFRSYLGYIAGNVYHNPTIVLVKPFALLLSLYVIKAFTPKEAGSNKKAGILLCALIAIAAGTAKPSYSIVILPAVIVMSAWAFYRKRYINLRLLLWGIFIPTMIILVVQFIWNYKFADKETDVLSKIVWAPFVVIKLQSNWILVKFFLSAAFPIYLLMVFFKEMQKRTDMQLAWISFIIAIFYEDLLAEQGPNLTCDNFGWGSMICIFLLFFYSVMFLLRKMIEKGINSLSKLFADKKISMACLIYLFHLGFGMLFFISRFEVIRWISKW